MYISSTSNPKIKQFAKYKEKKYREMDQCFLIENEHLIGEAIQAKLLKTLLVLPENTYPVFDGEIIEVSEEVMHKLKSNVSIPKMIGVCHMKSNKIELGTRIMLLDDVQDPGNAGTIIRTAYSFGFDSVILSNKSVDLYNEKLIRSTQGAFFHLPIIRGDLKDFIKKIKQENIPVLVTSLKDAKPLSTFPFYQKLALIFGNEGSGVREEILALADEKVYIEMNRFESLNVAQAASICAYYFRKEE